MGSRAQQQHERSAMDRAAELTTRFNAIDTNANGTLDKSELSAVFGEHAEQFLQFCDGDTDGALTLDEFTTGIVNDAKDLDDEVFTRDWLERMSSCIAEGVTADGGYYVFFDCDDCCYQNEWATAQKITLAISNYTEQLGVSKDQAYQLYKTHGTCLKGMLVEKIIEQEKVEDFLEKAHDIDYSDIAADPVLLDIITRCATIDRRFVFTASIKEHAERCLAKVLEPSTAADLFSVIVDTRTCDLETKHDESSFNKAMDAANVPVSVRESNPAACILLDDSVTNIKRAKAMGWTTVLVGKVQRDNGQPLETPAEADYHVESLHQLPEVMPQLFK